MTSTPASEHLPDGSPSVPDSNPADDPGSLAAEPDEDPAEGLPAVESEPGAEGS